MLDTTKITENKNEASVVAALAEAAVTPHLVDSDELHSIVVPENGKLEIIDLESTWPTPRRKAGTVTLLDGESMAAYINRHKDDATQLYFNDIGFTATAVFNDHAAANAGWRDHRAILRLVESDEWNAWKALDRRYLTQVEFAEHLEDNNGDVAYPSGADLLELAQTFQATTKVEFKSSKRLSDGQQQLTYTEDIDARGGTKGDLTIPKEFTLAIAPMQGGNPYRVHARLRFRVRDGKLTIGYVLDRPKDVERHAFKDVITEVVTTTELTAMYGTP